MLLPCAYCALALSAAPTEAGPTAAPSVALDEGPIVDAVEAVFAGQDVARVALPPVEDADVARRGAIERSLSRIIRDRHREEVITPALVRARLRANAEAQQREVFIDELQPFSADHVLYATVQTEGGSDVLRLRLFASATGEVRGEASAALGTAAAATTANVVGVKGAADDLAEQIAYAVEGQGIEVGTHTIGVPPLAAAPGAAADSRVDRFMQVELSRALSRRGFIVVERTRLASALDQQALGQALGEADAPQVGKLAGADTLVVGQVAEAGTTFLVTLRVVDSNTGAVVGGGQASLPRDDVVAMADVETRTPGEAALRSAVAPGWGQAYNGHGVKAVAFGVGSYGGLLTTVGLGVASGLSYRDYLDTKPGEGVSAEQAGQLALDRRSRTDALIVSTAIVGGVTAIVWGAGIVDALASSPNEDGGGA